MKKYYLDKDEWYPIYSISNDPKSFHCVDLTDEEHQKFLRIMKEFEEIQEIISDRVQWQR